VTPYKPQGEVGCWTQLDDRRELWDNRSTKEEVTTMCWEREEPKKASEEIDEILKKIVKEAEGKETGVPAKVG
jgi:hypothetical protein